MVSFHSRKKSRAHFLRQGFILVARKMSDPWFSYHQNICFENRTHHSGTLVLARLKTPLLSLQQSSLARFRRTGIDCQGYQTKKIVSLGMCERLLGMNWRLGIQDQIWWYALILVVPIPPPWMNRDEKYDRCYYSIFNGETKLKNYIYEFLALVIAPWFSSDRLISMRWNGKRTVREREPWAFNLTLIA